MLHAKIEFDFFSTFSQTDLANRPRRVCKIKWAKKHRRDNEIIEDLVVSGSHLSAPSSASSSGSVEEVLVASQISTMHQPVHQSVSSLPSVFNSKLARTNAIRHRNQAIKQKAQHRKAWEFFGIKDYDD